MSWTTWDLAPLDRRSWARTQRRCIVPRVADGREQSFEEWLRSPQPRMVKLVRRGPGAFGVVVRLPSGELVTSPLGGGARFVVKPPPPYGERPPVCETIDWDRASGEAGSPRPQ